MALHQAVARRMRGLHANDAVLAREADLELEQRLVRNPSRFASMLAPAPRR
jgi:hypothetical protein